MRTNSPTSAIARPIRPLESRPHCQPPRSIEAPTIGAPTALPSIIAEPCQPIASPRLPAGTARERSSAVAVTVGAQNMPLTNMSAANHVRSGATATSAAEPASSTSSTAEDGWVFRAP